MRCNHCAHAYWKGGDLCCDEESFGREHGGGLAARIAEFLRTPWGRDPEERQDYAALAIVQRALAELLDLQRKRQETTT